MSNPERLADLRRFRRNELRRRLIHRRLSSPSYQSELRLSERADDRRTFRHANRHMTPKCQTRTEPSVVFVRFPYATFVAIA